MENIKQQITDLDGPSFEELKRWVLNDETQRRAHAPIIEQAEADLIGSLQSRGVVAKPSYSTAEPAAGDDLAAFAKKVPAWKKPADKFGAYPPAALITHNGELYRNRRPGMNANEPGTPFSGWQNVTADFNPAPATPAPGVAEWKAGELVTKGDTRLHDGVLYVSQRLHTTKNDWAPDKTTGHWQKLD